MASKSVLGVAPTWQDPAVAPLAPLPRGAAALGPDASRAWRASLRHYVATSGGLAVLRDDGPISPRQPLRLYVGRPLPHRN
jgi:hypothetical protein